MASKEQSGINTWIGKQRVLLLGILVVALGLGLRLHHLRVYLPANPLLVADSIEYKEFGEYLVGKTQIKPVADRPLGFPLLMGVLYILFPVQGEDATVQIWATAIFDAAAVGLAFAVARHLGGIWAGVGAGLLLALNGEMIRNSTLAGTEQFYTLLSLLLFWGYLRLGAGHRSWIYWGVCLLGTWLVLVKQEGWFILGVLVGFYLWRLYQRREAAWQGPLLHRGLPLLLAPLLAYLGYKYYSSYVLGIPTMNYRTGNALFHAEFLAGRLPWGYMRDLRNEYFQMSNLDWLLHYHSPLQILGIFWGSTLLVFKCLGEMLVFAPVYLAALAGVVWAWRRQPLLVGLLFFSILPFCFLAEPHSRSSYTYRLLVPSLPWVILLAVLGAGWVATWLAGRRPALAPYLPLMALLLSGGYAYANLAGEGALGLRPDVYRAQHLAGAAAPQSAPAVDIDEVVAEGMRMQLSGEGAKAREAFEQVLARVPEYGPARMGLALLALGEGESEQAVSLLEQALAAAPYYAEAYMLLTSIQLQRQNCEAALGTCQRCVEYRPDYPPCHYLMGHLFLDYRQDYRSAAEHYEQYLDLNSRAHRNYKDFLQKKVGNNPGDAQSQEVLTLVERYLRTELQGRITPASWFYLHKDKAGALSQRVKPDDAGVYFYLGLAYERLGDKEQAKHSYEKSLRTGEFEEQSRQRLEALRQGKEATWPPLGVQLYQGETLVREAVTGYFDEQYWLVHGQGQ